MAGAALHFPELEPYATWLWILENLAKRGLLRNTRGRHFIPLMIMRKARLMCITWALVGHIGDISHHGV